MENSSRNAYIFLWIIFCLLPLYSTSLFFLKNIINSQNLYNSCLEEKSTYLVKEDCRLCCQKNVEYLSMLHIKERSIFFPDNDRINIILANFHSPSGCLFLLFLSPTLSLLFGIVKRDLFYVKVGLGSVTLLNIGLCVTIVYMIATFKDS